MSPLELWRWEQHDNVRLPSDQAFTAFLRTCSLARARRDYTAHATPVERRMLHRTRGRDAA